ncbi:MAG: putative RNA-binding Zn ribbon-like protein [Verrucomicrobiales bacterium]|jgi:predicted RNA-binding Zn ribbon-like protein
MHMASSTESEIRLTLEAMVELANAISSGALDAREKLVEAGFSRANAASQASVDRLTARLGGLMALFTALPELDDETASTWVNEELTELPIAPSIQNHDGVGPHIHWTPSTARFDDQVIADFLMALAQEVCDSGTIRFGRCAAHDCEDLFYDGTRNRSRRFCNDPRCASRTHTADHRARKKTA